MQKNLTEIVFILDRSGSMSGLESDTIGGFNSMIEKQKKEAGEAYVTTVLFDHQWQIIHDRVSLQTIKPLSQDEYFVGGATAMLDAIASTIKHIGNIHKYIRQEDVPAKTLFIITTDGMENASKHYNYSEVQAMIKECKEQKNWEFLFLGANIDAAETAENIGIDKNYAVNYHADSEGTCLNYSVLSDAISTVRGGKRVKADWKKAIDQDYQRRKR